MSTQRHTGISRYPLIDGLKAIAAQLILLHHMAAYGPLSDAVQHAFPDLISWLFGYGRMAVQVFLVLGGYLAARALAAGFGTETRASVQQFVAISVKRYLRLTVPFVATLLLAMACAALARHWAEGVDFIPAAPALDQFLAHGLLLHSVLGYESLSAGVWYVAIDFQLFILLAALLWVAERGARYSSRLESLDVILVTCMSIASLFFFNRDSSLDNWAPYFFGSYGLGTLTYWAHQRRPGAALALMLMLFLIPFALLDEFRPRLVVAMVTTLLLALSIRLPALSGWCRSRVVHHLGQTSYALFLVQFPIYMAATAICVEFEVLDSIEAPRNALFAVIITWAVSLYAATLFHRWVEAPASRLRFGARPAVIAASTQNEQRPDLAHQN